MVEIWETAIAHQDKRWARDIKWELCLSEAQKLSRELGEANLAGTEGTET